MVKRSLNHPDSVSNLTSIFSLEPPDQGGPTARQGFTYQDHVAVLFLLQMLADEFLTELWYETHDDITLIWETSTGPRPEFVQVKAVDNDQLWTVATLCKKDSAGKGKGTKAGTSMFEKSFSRLNCFEDPLFRLVTTVGVQSVLHPLTHNIGDRGGFTEELDSIVTAIEAKCPTAKPIGGRNVAYWTSNTKWEIFPSKSEVRNKCLLLIGELAEASGFTLCFDHAGKVFDEILRLAKEAGDAKWKPNPSLSQFARKNFQDTFLHVLHDVTRDLPPTTSINLTRKMTAANLDTVQIDCAKALRRDYAQAMRRTAYMDVDNHRYLPKVVQTNLATLYSQLACGELSLDGPRFHERCLAEIRSLNSEIGTKEAPQNKRSRGEGRR